MSLALGGTSPAVLDIARVILVFVGVITAGSAISMRPDLWWAWALGSATAWIATIALPGSWDSFPALFRVIGALAAGGAVLCVSSIAVRVGVSMAAILFHFSGIFMAATSPPPRPWINEQLFTRVYNPYLQFLYLRNAYQYYSPNPGPASILVFYLKTETGTDASGQKQYKTQWVVTPKRPADVRDPLGLSYYRRLSLTQQVAVSNPALVFPSEQSEKSDLLMRREYRSTAGQPGHIPYHPYVPKPDQYGVPNEDVSRYVLPSYASHVILERTPDAAAAGKTTVKVYRLDHQTTPVEQFRAKLPNGEYPPPYFPGTYRPYFLGEFNARGELIDPQEPFLYWLIPILPRDPGVGDPIRKTYFDYLSAHALDMRIEDVLKADEIDGKVFDWSQLKWSPTR
ncbi:MAG TPA: hypothetical protein VLM40_14710 [Gemmata sp.]|nr:hypothetical protein [Gemmata sp.]